MYNFMIVYPEFINPVDAFNVEVMIHVYIAF